MLRSENIFQKKYAKKNLDPKTVFLEIYLGIVFTGLTFFVHFSEKFLQI
jgi:hypothetical protein